MQVNTKRSHGSYQNPVYPFSCPDPFVMKYLGEYWCYSTGFDSESQVFPVLHSTDLVHWDKVGSAMAALPGGYTHYWAPEVTYSNGLFYLYYSVGDGTKMHIRVGTADRPEGPFQDSGKRLTPQDFAIDGHVFTDDDGSRYFFYATDFIDVERVGTGTVMDRMVDPFTLEGSPVPVTRARYDWQIFDPQREEKGGVCWHTVEGPFVLKRNQRYYQMFSGGNWQNASYGVAYGMTDRLDREDEWEQVCDGEESMPILSSKPEQGIIGPGHNSVVRGPDCRELYIVYHRWSKEQNARVMAIDRMGWEGEKMVVYGPTSTPQPAPAQPDVADFSQFVKNTQGVDLSPKELRMDAAVDLAEAASNFDGDIVMEVSFKIPRIENGGQVLITLRNGGSESSRFEIRSSGEAAVVVGTNGKNVLLADDFVFGAFHLLRIQVEAGKITWFLDDRSLITDTRGGGKEGSIQFACRQAAVHWTAFSITESKRA